MSARSAHVVFAGGGTGGHLFPGLAVAEQLRLVHPQIKIAFAGGGKPWEREQIARAGCEYLVTPSRPWPGRSWSAGQFLFENALGYCTAMRFLRSRHVAAVVGLGGYASAPTARAAISCGIPLVLLEQNALPGKVNRWLAPRASLVCAAFEESKAFLRTQTPAAFCLTGNPVRAAATHGTVEANERLRRVLVVGGSRGSRSLNQHAPLALATSKLAQQGWSILHQAGSEETAETQARYESYGLKATVKPFIEHLPRLLARSRLVICRAGGTTLAELAAAGTPAVLCPYPQAADDHQRRNAASFAGAGACLVVDEQHPPDSLSERLADAVKRLATDEELWQRFSESLLRIAHPDAARTIAELIIDRASGRKCA